MAARIAYYGNIVKDGLVLNLDAGKVDSYPKSGTTWRDISGFQNNATFTNGPTYDTGSFGSILFDGVDDYVINTSSVNIPVGNSSRTIQFWTYPKSNQNNFIQIGTAAGGGGGNQYYIIEFLNIAGTTFLFTDGKNAGNNLTISGSQLPTLNIWNHITFGSSGQNWFYYLNGALARSGTWPTTINTVGQKFIVGKRDDVVQATTNGNIAQVLIYNKDLSATEVLQNYNATKGRFGL